jgi:hypothetical protein
MPKPSRRTELDERLDVLEGDVERRLRALEDPKFTEVLLGFDAAPDGAEPLEKRSDADGEPFWVVKVRIT